nr:hypothetical protein [uncultured Desulfobulbus sp.]
MSKQKRLWIAPLIFIDGIDLFFLGGARSENAGSRTDAGIPTPSQCSPDTGRIASAVYSLHREDVSMKIFLRDFMKDRREGKK